MNNINQIGSLNNTAQSVATRAALDKELNATKRFEDMLLAAQNNQDEKELLEACRQFETFFINMMFKEMRKSVNTLSPNEKSPMETTFSEMLDEEYSKKATTSGGIGLANFMYKQILRQNVGIPAASLSAAPNPLASDGNTDEALESGDNGIIIE